ncbi:MAG: hypothetical protein ACRC1M_04125 [Methanobacteriaceae archaeon]
MTIATGKIESKFVKAIERIAKIENTSEEKVLNNIIEVGLRTRDKNLNETVEERIERLGIGDKIKIANKKTYKEGSNSFEELIGIYEAEESFDPVKAVDEIHDKKWKV